MNINAPFSDNKQTAQDFYNKGVALYIDDKHQEAVDMLEQAAELDPMHHESLGLLAQITKENGYIEESIECYGLAIQANSDHTPYKQGFLDVIAHHPVVAFNQPMKDIILSCLITDDINLSAAHLPWYGLLQHDPDFKPLFKIAAKGNAKEFTDRFLKLGQYDILSDPYFLSGLQKLVIFKPAFEKMLAHLRHFFLFHANTAQNPLTEAQTLMFLSSLAFYCHETEYIFELSDKEKKQIGAMHEKIAHNQHNDIELALYACYAPLSKLENATDIVAQYTAHPTLSDVTACQITNILQRAQIQAQISSLTPIENETSAKVRDQYETFPYPRWRNYSPDIKNEATEGFLSEGAPKILIAGCGTGKEAIELGHVFPNADILAIDLSRASLAYGIEKARQYGITNIKFQHGDILKLGALTDRYDFIASSGVLHHMKNPEDGLAVLHSLLKDGCTMRLAFYSRIARNAINKARNAIRDHKLENNNTAIRDFRARTKDFIDKKTFENISSFADYYKMSECRDLLFHVQEHQYDLAGIAKLLNDHNLEFKEFYLPPDTLERYQKMFPQDLVKTNLDNWRKFEERYPDSFAEMYRFWCMKI